MAFKGKKGKKMVVEANSLLEGGSNNAASIMSSHDDFPIPT